MDNVIDKTLKKILKTAQTLAVFKTILYLIGGILILLLNEKISDYIYLIVGINLILTSMLELSSELVQRRYKKIHNHIGSSIFTIVVGILILTVFRLDIYKVSVMWALVTVVNSIIEVNDGLHEIHNKNIVAFINLMFAVIEIMYSIFLLIEPEENTEHFITHIYLLGAGFIIESIEEIAKMIINHFKAKKKDKLIDAKIPEEE